MSKALYVEISWGGYTGYGKHNYYPNHVLTDELTVGGKWVTSKYRLVDLYIPSIGWDYYSYEASVVGQSYNKPSIYGTEANTIQLADPDGPPARVSQWYKIFVDDNYEIPAGLEKYILSGPFSLASSNSTSMSSGIGSLNFSAETFASYSFTSLADHLTQSAKSYIENALKDRGFGGLVDTINNAAAVYDALSSIHSNGFSVLEKGFEAISDPNSNPADYEALVDAYLAGTQDKLVETLRSLNAVPGNDAANDAARDILQHISFTGDGGVGVNGELSVQFSVGLLGGGVVEVGAGLKYGVVVGSMSNDAMAGHAENNVLIGGAGDDVIITEGSSLAFGGSGDDTIYAISGVGLLSGGSGDDNILIYELPGSAKGNINGGDGMDELIIDLSDSSDPVRYTLIASSSPSSSGYAGYRNFETLTVLGGSGDDVFVGSSSTDYLFGGDGIDLLVGGSGNDFLDSGMGGARAPTVFAFGGDSFESALLIDGTFRLYPGASAPSVRFEPQTMGDGIPATDNWFNFTAKDGAKLLVSLDELSNSNPLGDYHIELYDAQGALVTSAASGSAQEPRLLQYLSAGSYTVRITSSGSSTTLPVFAVVIELSGAPVPLENNQLRGGAGDDVFIVHQSDDRVIERAGEGRDRIESDVSWRLGDNVEDLTLTGADSSSGTGNSAANKIIGNSGDNILKGLEGNDWLDGRGGSDKLFGGKGNDIYVITDPGDLVRELAGEGTDLVYSSISYVLPSAVENLTLKGTASIDGYGNALANVIQGNSASNTLSGGSGNDSLFGLEGADILKGSDGNDILDGGAGNDTLIGGLGADRFVFSAAGLAQSVRKSMERIADFSHAQSDLIDLRNIDANVNEAGDQAFILIGTKAFSHRAGELRVETGTYTLLSADTDGDATADFYLKLDGSLNLVTQDFVL